MCDVPFEPTHVDLEHLFKVGDAVDHVVGPLLLDGDTSAVDTSRELSARRLELIGKVLLSGLDSLINRYRGRAKDGENQEPHDQL